MIMFPAAGPWWWNRNAEHLIHAVFVQRQFDRGPEITFLKRFKDITVGQCDFGSLERRLIGIGRQVGHRNIMIDHDMFRRLNAVHVALQPDVHQH